ncbi:MAG: allantoinase AllB [Lacipirellulaceae bacterium]
MPDQLTSTVLASLRVVTPSGERPANVVVERGWVVEVAPHDPDAALAAGGEDWGAVALLPGLVDPHVHLNEPGNTHWEGVASGTAAAALGGVTTLIDMPLNSLPVTTSVAALEAKRAATCGKASVDVAFHGGLVAGSADQIGPLLDAGVVGIKAFLCHSGLDEFPNATRDDLAAAMPLLAERGVPLLAHAELVRPLPPMADPRRYADYLASRPVEFERDAIEMLVELCEATGCRTHVVHLADAGSLGTLRAARRRGLPITVETCPHYLAFTADEIADGATLFKCAPPLREAAHREGLWSALAEGLIDFVATDHSPCPPQDKRLPELGGADAGRFDRAWGGIASLGLALPVVWAEAAVRGHSLSDVARWLSDAPATLVGVEGGIRRGAPANLVAFDPDAAWIVEPARLAFRHKQTPYAGRTLRGVVRQTYLRGEPLLAAGQGGLATLARPGRGGVR